MQRTDLKLLAPSEIAPIYGDRLCEQRLREMRAAGLGPRFRKIGRSVVYRIGDIEAWLDGGIVDPATGAPPAHAQPLIAEPTLRIVAREVSDAIDQPPAEWVNWTAGDRIVHLIEIVCDAVLIATDADR